MELFSILCGTCATRLRVTQPNAVGQLLACPKCSNMVRVVPPAGWEPTPEVANSLSSEQLSKIRASISSPGFEDIDDLLQDVPPPKKKRPRQRPPSDRGHAPKSPPRKRPKAPPAPAKRTQRSQSAVAVLPTDDWTSQQSKQRKKLLIGLAAALGALIIIGGATAAYFTNAEKKTALGSTPPKPISNVEPLNPEDDAQPSDDKTNDTPADTPDTPLATVENPDKPADMALTDPPLEPATGLEPKPKSENGLEDTMPTEPAVDSNTDPAVDIPRPPSNPLESLPTEPEHIEKSDDIVTRDLFENQLDDESNLGNLAELLDEANTSITEMRDLASEIEDQETVGISKYFIDRPDPVEFDVANKMDLPCAGLIAQGKPMISILREITAMTGVPFALDVENLRAAKLGFSLPTDIKMEQDKDHRTKFRDIVEAVTSQHQLAQVQTDTNVIVLYAIDITKLQVANYPLPKLVQDANLADNMVALVKALIAPETWTRETDPGTIEISGIELTVNQTPDVHVQLQRFFTKLLKVEAGDPLSTRWTDLQSAMSRPPKLKLSLPLGLEDLFSKLQQNTGVTLLIDWPELVKEEWNPTTLVPGEFNEDSLGKTLKEIARSMRLTLRAIDENTVELTTFNSVAARSEVELYYYGDIIEGALTQDLVFDIVNQALGKQFRKASNVRMEYFPQVKCIVVVAPQTLHRQLELVLNKLRTVGS